MDSHVIPLIGSALVIATLLALLKYSWQRSLKLAAELDAEKSKPLPYRVKHVFPFEDELLKAAQPVVKALEAEAQSGEWKFHQAYAALLKTLPNVEKWKIGLAIHWVISELRKGSR